MDSGTIPPQDDTPPAAAGDEADIEFPDDPRIPRPEDADPRVSKELGGAAPAIGPGASGEEPRAPSRDGSGAAEG